MLLGIAMRPIDNPNNRFFTREVEWEEGQAPPALLRVHEEASKQLLSKNESPDLPFRYSLNPYRGCQHACAYCYARPSHQYWGFGAGSDFDREIVVKINAPERLRATFAKKSWQGDPIAFSGNTDCYQPLEARYRLTRALLSICAEHKNPVGVITKSSLVIRDLDVLAELHRAASVVVFVSIPFSDDATRRAVEPGAPPVHRRFEALRVLSEAGIETGVAVAPIIPGLNDQDIGAVLTRAREAGARRAFYTLLRLPAEVRPVFLSRLRDALPLRAGKVERGIREMRDGRLNDPRFGERMQGSGVRWQAVRTFFEMQHKRLGFETSADVEARRWPPDATEGAPAPPARTTVDQFEPPVSPAGKTFERPSRQLKLF